MGVPVVGLFAVSAAAHATWGPAYRDTVGFIVDPVLAAVLIAQLVAFSGSPVFHALEWSWVRYLGRISYSIYLYQQIVIEPSQRALAGFPTVVRLAGVIAAVVAAASLSHFVVERPFLRLKRVFARPIAARPA